MKKEGGVKVAPWELTSGRIKGVWLIWGEDGILRGVSRGQDELAAWMSYKKVQRTNKQEGAD